jgi:hypothetical protein
MEILTRLFARYSSMLPSEYQQKLEQDGAEWQNDLALQAKLNGLSPMEFRTKAA